MHALHRLALALAVALILPMWSAAQDAALGSDGSLTMSVRLTAASWTAICAGFITGEAFECTDETAGAKCPTSQAGLHWFTSEAHLCLEEDLADPRCTTGRGGQVADTNGDGHVNILDAGRCPEDRAPGTVIKILGDFYRCDQDWVQVPSGDVDEWAVRWASCPSAAEVWPPGSPVGAVVCRPAWSWAPMVADCKRLIERKFGARLELYRLHRAGSRALKLPSRPAVAKGEELDIPPV